jgi:hypothetical protein
MLEVAIVVRLVAPAVAEVNASNESNVTLGSRHVADDHELLVV